MNDTNVIGHAKNVNCPQTFNIQNSKFPPPSLKICNFLL